MALNTNPDTIRPQTMRKYFRIMDEYIINGYDAVKAYQSVYPNANKLTARGEFCKIKKIPPVAEYLKQREREAYDSLGLSIERVYGEMAKIAFTDDPDCPITAKTKMLEVLMKNLKEDKGKTANTVKLVIGVEEDEEDSDILEEEDI